MRSGSPWAAVSSLVVGAHAGVCGDATAPHPSSHAPFARMRGTIIHTPTYRPVANGMRLWEQAVRLRATPVPRNPLSPIPSLPISRLIGLAEHAREFVRLLMTGRGRCVSHSYKTQRDDPGDGWRLWVALMRRVRIPHRMMSDPRVRGHGKQCGCVRHSLPSD